MVQTCEPGMISGAGFAARTPRVLPRGANLVLLAPVVATEYPNATAVTKALREIIESRRKHRVA